MNMAMIIQKTHGMVDSMEVPRNTARHHQIDGERRRELADGNFIVRMTPNQTRSQP